MVSGTISDYSALSTADAVNVGLDMGNRNWVIAVRFYRTGALRQFSFKGQDCADHCLAKIREFADAGHSLHVTCETGRNGFTPARQLRQHRNITVTLLPVNRLEVVCSGKRVKTDRIDAIFLSTLDPRLMPKLPGGLPPPLLEQKSAAACFAKSNGSAEK